MTKLYTILFSVAITTFAVNILSAQSIEELNKFRYINVPKLEYYITSPKNAGSTLAFDIYGIQKIVKQTLRSKGFTILETTEAEASVNRDNCEIGYCHISQMSNLDPNRFDEIVLYFSDCNYKLVYQCGAKVKSNVVKKVTTAIPLGIIPMQQATKEALKEFDNYEYTYNADKSIVKNEFPVSQFDYKEIKAYLKNESNKLDLIEGIYESVDVDFYYVKLAIIKNSAWFDLVIIDSDNISWKPMQIRGKIKSDTNDRYTGNWLFSPDNNLKLEIEKGKQPKAYEFTFVDSTNNEYFEIKFKRKFPK